MTLDEFSQSYKARAFFRATPAQWRILPVLVFREQASYEALISQAWPNPDEEPEYSKNTIKVQMFRLRKLLETRGLTIHIVWGKGYFMTKEDRTKAIELARKAIEQ